MKQLILFLNLLLFGANTLAAQKYGQDRIDSLVSKLSETKVNLNKLKLLSDISFEYSNLDPDKGIEYGNQLLTLATKLNIKEFIGNGYLYIGINYLSKSDYPNALDYELKALDIFEKISDLKKMAKPLNNIGIIYFNQNEMGKALEYYLKALKIYDAEGMKKQKATTLGNIAMVYQNKGQIDKAMTFNSRALKIFEELNDMTGIARMQGNIGNIYDIKHDYVKALQYKFRALDLHTLLGDLLATAKVCDNISFTFIQLAKDNNHLNLPDSLSDKISSLDKAEYYVKKAIAINLSIGNLNDLSINYEGLSQIYFEKNDFKNSLEYYKKTTQLRNSIYSQENKSKIKTLEARKDEELVKKEHELQILHINSARIERWYYISLLSILLAFIFLIYRYFIIQKRNNRLITIEMKKSNDLLLNILPVEVADELKRTGESTAKQYDHVTVLFTDFVNFTGISEEMSPKELVNEIHKNFTEFDAIIESNGLEKIKTIGDAYLAVCGMPNETEHHAQKVIQAALKIQAFIAKSESKFKIRIGINSGPVVAGIVGIRKYAYDIWGDTVNTAARMEQNSEPGKINISGSTYDLIKEEFKCTYRGKVQAKNKGEIDMYFVDELIM